ncbi:MAG: YbaB/EbfC family nucleoid-associated protein [Fimbriimonadaceae bacterium]|nr:YbaB/EbfC family nucleoid-associated protein [Fimbriimonadaceae bacterium]
MKLPKNFVPQDLGGMMKQVQDAMAEAQNLEAKLAAERIEIDQAPIKATFDGTGSLLAIKIDPAAVDPEEVDALEDLIVGVVRAGFERATELRNSKVQGILPNLPDIPGITR